MSDRALADIAEPRGLVGGPFGSNLVGKDYVSDGIPVIRGVNMGRRYVYGDFVFVSPDKFARDLSRNNARPGDVIFTQRGTLGQVAIVPDRPHREYVVSQSQMRLRVDSGIVHPGYVYYACRTPAFIKQVADNAISTGVPHINLGIVSRLTIPDRSFSDQQAIVDVLGAVDDKIEANERIAQSSLELARVTFRSEQLAGSWECVTLADAVASGWLQLGDGYRTKGSEYGKPGLRILRAGDIGHDLINPSGGDFVSNEFRASIGAKASQPGDVVLTTKGTVGRVAVVPSGIDQVVYSPQVCYFRVLDPTRLSPGFLSAWFRSDDLQRQAEARMFKSDMAPYINLADIQSMVMPLTSPADQHRIGESQAALERAAQVALHENGILAQTRDELLPLLMSGRLRVRDAERVAGRVF